VLGLEKRKKKKRPKTTKLMGWGFFFLFEKVLPWCTYVHSMDGRKESSRSLVRLARGSVGMLCGFNDCG